VKPSVNYRGPQQQTSGGNEQRRNTTRRNYRNRSRRRPTGGNAKTNNNSDNNSNSNTNNKSNNRTFNIVRPSQRTDKPRTENTLYVSNLPFDLDDNDLKHIFSEFNVKSANVANRSSGKSRGFGFVEFHNSHDQNEALKALDQSEVNTRVITVKVATGHSNSERSRSRRNNNNSNNNQRRNNSPSRQRNNSPSRQRNNSPSRRRNNSSSRQSKPKDNNSVSRTPSATMVYVSNLPFSVEDSDLQNIFKGHKITQAYVAKRRNGRSKGFGFVDFGSAEEQLKALKLNGADVQGRIIVVQVARKVEQKQN